jgi:hypothetical protein
MSAGGAVVGQSGDEFGQRRMLGPIVLLNQDRWVTLPQPVRIELSRSQVIVLVEVDRQSVHGQEPHLEGDEHNDDRRDPPRDPERRGSGTAAEQPVHLR